MINAAIEIFYDLREQGFEKAPATSELLNWIGALEQEGFSSTDLQKIVNNGNRLPFLGTLLKRAGDIQNYTKRIDGREKKDTSIYRGY